MSGIEIVTEFIQAWIDNDLRMFAHWDRRPHCFPTSDDAAFATGQVAVVAGGMEKIS
jgi:hypothetical protein